MPRGLQTGRARLQVNLITLANPLKIVYGGLRELLITCLRGGVLGGGLRGFNYYLGASVLLL